MDEKLIEENLKKMGYWQQTYSAPNAFGTGPTKLAHIAFNKIKNKQIKTILELGCGQGRDSIFFAEKKYNVTATDFSPDAVEFVKNHALKNKMNNLHTMKLDISENFSFDQKFDLIYSNLALQFFDKKLLRKIFKNVNQSLKDNSLFIFSTKKPGDKYHNVGVKVGTGGFKINDITRYFFTKKELSDIVVENFIIETFDEKNHTNLDSTISAWWYVISKKVHN